MLLFAREKIVLLSVPKTGTSAWAAALGAQASLVLRAPPALKHMPLRRFRRRLLPLLEASGVTGLEIVAVMRAPEDWLGSWYRYRRRPALNGQPASTGSVSFDAFVRAYLAEDRPAYADLGSQARFLDPGDSGPPVDHLFRYENPGALVAFLESRLGRRIDLPRRNRSPAMPLALSPATRTRLRAERAADFALYESIAAAGSAWPPRSARAERNWR
ncbi:hypothetical protein SAMN05444722_0641 [Rhodovulum sp. ES.010]|nr:hypothetical protein [Rhodovulum sp. ES.010]SIO15673.1 hypothetical protein SAMN05444722_0641 [Rhodovulum sp. ES.010]